MKKLIHIIIILTLSILFHNCAEEAVEVTTGTIKGVTYNFETSEIVGHANISTNPPSSSVTSDTLNGAFTIEHVDPGIYTVIAIKSGFDSAKVKISVLADEQTIADLELVPDTTANQ